MLISLHSYKVSTKITGIQLFTGTSAKLTTIIVSQQNYINYITIFFSSPQKKASYEHLHRMPHLSRLTFSHRNGVSFASCQPSRPALGSVCSLLSPLFCFSLLSSKDFLTAPYSSSRNSFVTGKQIS